MENEIRVDQAGLIPQVQELLVQKARFATATCLDMGDKFEVIYHFEFKEGVEFMKHIRLSIDKEDILPSISSIYFCAALVENEIQDHFKIKISGLAIDFQKRFLRAKESPEFALTKEKEAST